MQINGNFCGLVLNQPLGGLHVIEGLPLLADSTDGMASVAAYTYQKHSVVFIGTRGGSLKKVSPGTLGMWVQSVRMSLAAPWTGPGRWGTGAFPGWAPGAQLCSTHMLECHRPPWPESLASCGSGGRAGLSPGLPAGRAGAAVAGSSVE